MKKGFLDTIYLVVGIFVLFLTLIIIIGLKSAINPAILDSLNESNITGVNMTLLNNTLTTIDTGYQVIDIGFIILILGAFLSILIALWYVRSNPLLLIIGLIVLIVLVFVTIILRDSFIDVVNSNVFFNESVAELPKSNLFINNLPVIILVVCGIFLVVMYAKTGGII